jgi:hypothetical protein
MEITEQMKEMAVSLVEELNGKSAGSSHAIELHDDYVDIVRHTAGIRVLCAVSLGIFRQMMEDESVRRLIVKNVLRVLKAGELEAIRRRERKVSQEDPSAEG